ncbi:ABC transporter substrate-binding protein [Cohnella silvisoli]|uniref:ABC transporter substrate-binding protein n=1 Tax=Cohnella silvisoli TaxID=2873699 RepID=A0ABV1KXD9_9BACL|nr:ABC transporter substrate-binding protein [Cohnella silvisoli]MCD9023716.1 ABC transporter substrate-binding protein [Cohnella silvisoli]
MTKKMKVTTVMLLVIVVLLSACSSGGKNTETSSPSASETATSSGQASQQPGSGDPVKLTAFINQSPMIANISENPFTKQVEEKTNVKLDFVVGPSNDNNDKRNVLMASGDYPEIFLSGNFSPAEQMKFGTQGVFLPLNDLIEKYAPNIKQILTDRPDIKSAITAPDGNIYAIPQVNECYHCWYSQKLWINQKWLDNLGLKMPTTTEEYANVLRAFKNDDPNKNGKKDEVPLSGALYTWHGDLTGFLMNAFIYNTGDGQPYSYIRVKDGKVQLSASQPEWLDGLKYMHSLYKEGLIDQQAFTQNQEGLQQLGNNPDTAILGSFSIGHVGMGVSRTTDRHKEYTAVPPLKGPNGVQLSGYYKSVGNQGRFVITNKAGQDAQIAAIKMMDYLWTEEGSWGQVFSVKGDKWFDADAGQLGSNGKAAKIKVDPSYFTDQVRSDGWDQAGPDYRSRDRFESQAVSQDIYSPDGYEVRLVQETKKYEGHEPKPEEFFPMDIFISPEDGEKAAQFKQSIEDYVKTSMLQFIAGDKNVDKDWDSYLNGFKGLKLDEYLQILQKAYDSNKSK